MASEPVLDTKMNTEQVEGYDEKAAAGAPTPDHPGCRPRCHRHNCANVVRETGRCREEDQAKN